jgi:hypothetical protein
MCVFMLIGAINLSLKKDYLPLNRTPLQSALKGTWGDLYNFILQVTSSLTDAKFQSTDLILHTFMTEIICYKHL